MGKSKRKGRNKGKPTPYKVPKSEVESDPVPSVASPTPREVSMTQSPNLRELFPNIPTNPSQGTIIPSEGNQNPPPVETVVSPQEINTETMDMSLEPLPWTGEDIEKLARQSRGEDNEPTNIPAFSPYQKGSPPNFSGLSPIDLKFEHSQLDRPSNTVDEPQNIPTDNPKDEDVKMGLLLEARKELTKFFSGIKNKEHKEWLEKQSLGSIQQGLVQQVSQRQDEDIEFEYSNEMGYQSDFAFPSIEKGDKSEDSKMDIDKSSVQKLLSRFEKVKAYYADSKMEKVSNPPQNVGTQTTPSKGNVPSGIPKQYSKVRIAEPEEAMEPDTPETPHFDPQIFRPIQEEAKGLPSPVESRQAMHVNHVPYESSSDRNI